MLVFDGNAVVLQVVEMRMGICQLYADSRGFARWDRREDILEYLRNIVNFCNQLELPVAALQAHELHEMLRPLNQRGLTSVKLQPLLDNLAIAIQNELKTKRFFFVPAQRAALFNETPFGDEVSTKFPSAKRDVREAAYCFALARWSACVFHLTRALEVAMGVLAKELGVPPAENWNKLLNQVDAALGKGLTPPSPKPSNWKELETFYSEASAHFRNIKNAWRNPVSHHGFMYDEEEALAILRGTESFMRTLAKRLSE